MSNTQFYAQWKWIVGEDVHDSGMHNHYCREIAFSRGARVLKNSLQDIPMGSTTLRRLTAEVDPNISYVGAAYLLLQQHYQPESIKLEVTVAFPLSFDIQRVRDCLDFMNVQIEPVTFDIEGFSTQRRYGFIITGGVETIAAFFWATLVARNDIEGRTYWQEYEEEAFDAYKNGQHAFDWLWMIATANGPGYEYIGDDRKDSIIARARRYAENRSK